MNLRRILFSLLVAQLLVACGGGDGDVAEAIADDRKVPASALASATAYSQWAASLPNSETGAPVAFEDGMMAPKSETEAPIGVR